MTFEVEVLPVPLLVLVLVPLRGRKEGVLKAARKFVKKGLFVGILCLCVVSFASFVFVLCCVFCVCVCLRVCVCVWMCGCVVYEDTEDRRPRT